MAGIDLIFGVEIVDPAEVGPGPDRALMVLDQTPDRGVGEPLGGSVGHITRHPSAFRIEAVQPQERADPQAAPVVLDETAHEIRKQTSGRAAPVGPPIAPSRTVVVSLLPRARPQALAGILVDARDVGAVERVLQHAVAPQAVEPAAVGPDPERSPRVAHQAGDLARHVPGEGVVGGQFACFGVAAEELRAAGDVEPLVVVDGRRHAVQQRAEFVAADVEARHAFAAQQEQTALAVARDAQYGVAEQARRVALALLESLDPVAVVSVEPFARADPDESAFVAVERVYGELRQAVVGGQVAEGDVLRRGGLPGEDQRQRKCQGVCDMSENRRHSGPCFQQI